MKKWAIILGRPEQLIHSCQPRYILFMYGDVCKSLTPKTPRKQQNLQEIKEFLELNSKETLQNQRFPPHEAPGWVFWDCFRSFQLLILKAELKVGLDDLRGFFQPYSVIPWFWGGTNGISSTKNVWADLFFARFQDFFPNKLIMKVVHYGWTSLDLICTFGSRSGCLLYSRTQDGSEQKSQKEFLIITALSTWNWTS